MRRTLVLAVFLIACGGAPPELPGENLPLFRITPPAVGDAREFMACLVPGKDEIELRLLYEPEGAAGRTKILTEEDYVIPWPAGVSMDPSKVRMLRGMPLRRPALILCADADLSWNRLMRACPRDELSEVPRMFLAGKTKDGRTGALPVLMLPSHVEAYAGMLFTPGDLVQGVDPDGVLEIRITRDGDRVRYRWGHSPVQRSVKRWAGGDIFKTDAEVRSGGEGPLLPEMARFLTARFRHGFRSIAIVFLQTADTVQVIDVLRAVECAAGDAAVCFIPNVGLSRGGLRLLKLPTPPSVEPPMKDDDGSGGRRLIVNVLPDGTIRVKGERCDLDGLGSRLPAAGQRVLLRADRRLPWPDVRPVVKAVRNAACRLELAFEPAAPGLPEDMMLAVPHPTVAGRAVRIPNLDRTVEQVWVAVHEALVGGASGVDFE